MKKVTNLKCTGRSNPIGVDKETIKFSWILESDENDVRQNTYQIVVAMNRENVGNELFVWDSGQCTSEECHNIPYKGDSLDYKTGYYWMVKITDENDHIWESELQYFETALDENELAQSNWIMGGKQYQLERDEPALDEEGNALPITLSEIEEKPVLSFRRKFEVPDEIKKARIYITALGVYKVSINGQMISKDELAPGFTAYDHFVEYQTYNISQYVHIGENKIDILVGDGWYRGRMGFAGDNCQYGTQTKLLFRIEIEDKEHHKIVIKSDEKCEYRESAIIYSDLMVGEKYDARRENDSYKKVYEKVEIGNEDVKLVPSQIEPIRITETLPAKEIIYEEDGTILVDFGQNISGKVCLKLQESSGTEIILEHTEVLDQNGNFMNNISESYKNQTDIYICSGIEMETYTPYFTYHGFQFVRITGCKNQIRGIKALVMQSLLEKTSTFECSDDRLNQLQSNIEWSQKGNMISIPTDCPQREKAGWTGDVTVYCRTACFNMNMEKFFSAWLESMKAQQGANGAIPLIIPKLPGYEREFEGIETSAGWGDVCVILPWTLYEYYGDKEILKKNFQMMEEWNAYVERKASYNENGEKKHGLAQYIWDKGFHFGDWLTPSVSIDIKTGQVDMMKSAQKTMDIIPTIFYAYTTKLISRIAAVLGYKEKIKRYRKKYDYIKQAFQYRFVDQNGYLKSDLQGCFVLALTAELLDEKERNLQRLLELIEKNCGKLDTGFMSVPYILDLLSSNGYEKEAISLLFQEECPSWLYEIKQGASTMWESWQCILENGQRQQLSYNHYSYGCVGSWIYENILGIKALEPGYRHIRINPIYVETLSYAKGSYHSVYGTIYVEWKRRDSKIILNLKIPVGIKADVHVGNNIVCVQSGRRQYIVDSNVY